MLEKHCLFWPWFLVQNHFLLYCQSYDILKYIWYFYFWRRKKPHTLKMAKLKFVCKNIPRVFFKYFLLKGALISIMEKVFWSLTLLRLSLRVLDPCTQEYNTLDIDHHSHNPYISYIWPSPLNPSLLDPVLILSP